MRRAKVATLRKMSVGALNKRWNRLRAEQLSAKNKGDLPRYLTVQREMTKTAKIIVEKGGK